MVTRLGLVAAVAALAAAQTVAPITLNFQVGFRRRHRGIGSNLSQVEQNSLRKACFILLFRQYLRVLFYNTLLCRLAGGAFARKLLL